MVESNFQLKRKHKYREDEFYPKVVYIPHVPIEYDLPEDKRKVKNQMKKYYEVVRMVRRNKRKYGEEEDMVFPSDQLRQKIIEEIKKQRPPLWHK